jgi:hypothetical protein
LFVEDVRVGRLEADSFVDGRRGFVERGWENRSPKTLSLSLSP